MLDNTNISVANTEIGTKKKILRKIIAFIFALNMLIARFFGGFADVQPVAGNDFAPDGITGYSYSSVDSIYSTQLPMALAGDISTTKAETYNKLVGDVYNNVFGYAAGFNVFVEGDTTITSADCGGRIAVGGNLNITANGGWYEINNCDPNAATADYAAVIVGGTLNVKMNNGKVWANELGDFSHSNYNGNVYVGGVNSDECKFNFSDTFTYLRESSAHLASLPANGV